MSWISLLLLAASAAEHVTAFRARSVHRRTGFPRNSSAFIASDRWCHFTDRIICCRRDIPTPSPSSFLFRCDEERKKPNFVPKPASSKLSLYADDYADGETPSHSSQGTESIQSTDIQSEMQVIKILRTLPRYHVDLKNETLRKGAIFTSKAATGTSPCCHTAQDVLTLLRHVSSTSFPQSSSSSASTFVLSTEEIRQLSEQTVKHISLNIAAAALRRLVEPPFLTASNTDVCEIEREVYSLLLKFLLQKLNSGMMQQFKFLSNYRFSSSSSDSSVDPVLMPHNETLVTPPAPDYKNPSDSLNWYALADILFSLSKLHPILNSRHRTDCNRNKNKYIQIILQLSKNQNYSPILTENLLRYLAWNNEITSMFVRCIGPRRVVRDLIRPLDILAGAHSMPSTRNERGSMELSSSYNAILSVASTYLALPHSLSMLTASDLATTLYSMAKLYCYPRLQSTSSTYVQQRPQSMSIQAPQRILLRAIMRRLRKYTMRSTATGRELVRAIWSVGQLLEKVLEQDQVRIDSNNVNDILIFDDSDEGLPRSIEAELFRNGKQNSSILQELFSSGFGNLSSESGKDKGDLGVRTETLQEEAVVMFHTLINELITPPRDFTNKNKSKEHLEQKHPGDNIPNNTADLKLYHLSLGQIDDVLKTAIALEIPHTEMINTVTIIAKYLTSPKSLILERCRDCKDVARILLSFQRLRVGTGILGSDTVDFNENHNTMAKISGISLEEHCVQVLGNKFLDIVNSHHGDTSIPSRRQHKKQRRVCEPKTLNTILRSGVMMFPGKSAATQAMLDAASILILEDDGIGEDYGGKIIDFDEDFSTSSDSSFLSDCNEFELSNFLWAFAMARRFDEEVFVSLTDQLLDDDVVTSSTASRVMWSSAMLMSISDASPSDNTHSEIEQTVNKQLPDNHNFSPANNNRMTLLQERQVDVFHHMGGVLLSSKLSPIDASSAMWAMAKTSYALDRGIFDFLAESLASKEMIENSNTRQISQALWACGKMVAFEDPMMNVMTVVQGRSNNPDDYDIDDETEDGTSFKDYAGLNPPYMKSATKYLEFLVTNREQMTPKHTAQSIWAIGRLRIYDESLLDKMGEIALNIAPQCNSQEIANIVWGLSKVGFLEDDVISRLIRFITTSTKLTNECTCQEAANALYALGRLQIRDEDSFSSLSAIMLNRMQEATSQAIANALWAHEIVDLQPPRELLDCWAHENLGLIAAFGKGIPEEKGEKRAN
ncbi:hypothetical protein ACHAXS_007295 [Conticribra weissflogii]